MSRRSERGVTVVEFALALPVFFALVLALLDLGNAFLQTSQATSAAADGARVAIVLPDSGTGKVIKQAATAGTPANDAIKRAVRARVVGKDIPDSGIVVMCSPPGGTPSAGYCSSSSLDRQRDKVVVQVQWTWTPLTFVGQALPVQTIKGRSTMALVFIPTGFTGTTSTSTSTTPVTVP